MAGLSSLTGRAALRCANSYISSRNARLLTFLPTTPQAWSMNSSFSRSEMEAGTGKRRRKQMNPSLRVLESQGPTDPSTSRRGRRAG